MTADKILCVTTSYDSVPGYVGATLVGYGVPFFRLDTNRFPSEAWANIDPQGGPHDL